MTSTLTLALRARNANRIKPRYQICLIHPFDPRGEKVGGLETYIRDFITFHPTDTDILFIGVDSSGELELGRLHRPSICRLGVGDAQARILWSASPSCERYGLG